MLQTLRSAIDNHSVKATIALHEGYFERPQKLLPAFAPLFVLG